MADYEEHEDYSPRKHSDPGNGSRHHEHRSRDAQNSRSRSRRREHEGEHIEDEKERSGNRERDIEQRRHRSRDWERNRDDRHNRDYDRDYERRHRRKSPSHSHGKSRDRSRSPLDSHARDNRRSSKKPSGFDLAPPTAALSNAALPGQVGGLPQAAIPGVFPGMYPYAGGAQFGGIPVVTMQSMTQQATRHARRVYVGGLPPLANEQTIATFFSQVMTAIGGSTAGPGEAVVNVYINHEKKFAFVEMRTVEEASNAMALDGIIFEGVAVRVRRPTDYNPSVAATLGPSQPSPHLNLAAVGLTPGAVGGADGPDRVFVGGLPYYLTETQIKELLESFGQLRGFDLVKDPETGNSKGYGFCVYQDSVVTDVACAALNGLKMGDKTLTVRRATASGQPKPDQANVLFQAQQHISMQKLALQVGGGMVPGLEGLIPGMIPGLAEAVGTADLPTKVVCLSQVVSIEELRDDEVFEEIYDDMKEECAKYGSLVSIVIPRPMADEDHVSGLGKVFLEYSTSQEAARAYSVLNGRRFGGNTVSAKYFSEDKFSRGEYED